MGGFAYREKKLDRDDQKNRKSDEMRIEDFRKLIILAVKNNFPDASILLAEKRDITLDARIKITEKIFVEVYYNSLTDKKSFALIKENQRILGYDNYQYWHIHPRDNVTSHVPCQEPSIEKIFEEMKEIILSL
jgi:hypothetical protein